MAKPGDYILVHFIRPVEDGYDFARHRSEWPHHVTLGPWFAATGLQAVEQVVCASTACLSAFTALVGSETDFRPGTHVSLFADTDGFQSLHDALLEGVRSAGMPLGASNFTGRNFTPHITHHGDDGDPRIGETYTVDTVSIVRLDPGALCKVVRTISFG